MPLLPRRVAGLDPDRSVPCAAPAAPPQASASLPPVGCRLFFLSILCWAPPALANDSALAVEASEAHGRWCAQANQGDVGLAAEALGPVSAVWGQVSEAWEARGELSLLYWRAMLGHCLSQEELAERDFLQFHDLAKGNPAYAGQVRDAERWLVRSGHPPASPPPQPAKVALGVAGAGSGVAAGVLAGLSAWQWSELQADWQPLVEIAHTQGEGESLLAAAQDHEQHQRGLVGASVGAGVAGLTLVVVSALLPKHAPSVTLAPLPGGVAMGARW